MKLTPLQRVRRRIKLRIIRNNFSNPHRCGPPKPSSIRGKSATAIIDEFPIHFVGKKISEDTIQELTDYMAVVLKGAILFPAPEQ